jgi:predicted DNA-binding transcriptional regulator AlpA
MSSEKNFCASQATFAYSAPAIILSPWVNERFPAWEQLLSAHDVARLTRQPKWMVFGLILIGRFPRQRMFHGRPVGWLRPDVMEWLESDSLPGRACTTRNRVIVQNHRSPPLPCQATRITNQAHSRAASRSRI